MTQMKFLYKLTGQPAEAVAGVVDRIYGNPGSSFMAVVEFKRKRAVEDEEDGQDNSVLCRVAGLEVGSQGSQENTLREIQRALYLARTAEGTIGANDDIQLARQTVELASGLVQGEEIARLSAGLDHWAGVARDLASNTGLREMDIRKQLGELAAGLAAVRKGQLALAGSNGKTR